MAKEILARSLVKALRFLPCVVIALWPSSPLYPSTNTFVRLDAIATPQGEFRQWASGASASTQPSTSIWSAMQAAGPPDSDGCGDRQTAWSPSIVGLSTEWIELTYETPVRATMVRIRETFNSGFVTQVQLRDTFGSLNSIQIGPDRTPCPGWFELTFPETPYLVRGVRVTTSSPLKEEVDAVELIGRPLSVNLPATKNITYRYDKLNRLVEVIYEDGTKVAYTYDAAGNRLTEVVTGSIQIPVITGASVSGKKLFVLGRAFKDGAKILLNGQQQKTQNDSANPTTALIAKKSGKKTMPGDRIQVRNPDGELSNEIIFNSPGDGCSFSILPGSQSFPASGGSGTVNVTAPAGCNWTAVSNSGFVTITSGSSGSGNGTVNYSVAVNSGSSQRTGTMTISDQTFTVTQAGAGGACSFAIAPTSQSFSGNGGAGNVGVTAPNGCNWTAASNAGFITITSGTSGSGNGTVNYTVSANPGSTSRTGTMTIAGQTFNVTQAGAVTGGTVFAYVTNASGDSVSVINVATNTIAATIPVGDEPRGLAITPDGSHVYVANRRSNTVSVINTATNTVAATIQVGTEPVGVAVNPAGTRAYVTNLNNVSVIDTATNTVLVSIAGVSGRGVAVNPAGTRVYVANGGNTLKVIDATSNILIGTIVVGNDPYGVVVNPAGTRVYVTSPTNRTISMIDTATNTVIATLRPGEQCYGIAMTPDGSRLYVSNYIANTLSVIDTFTNAVIATVQGDGNPLGLAVTPDGTRVYVADISIRAVSVINTVTNVVVAGVGVGASPDSVAIGRKP